MNIISIGKENSYNAYIGNDSLNQLINTLKESKATDKVAIISDSNVCPLYGQKIEKLLTDAGYSVFTFVFEAGESSKNFDTYKNTLDFLSEKPFTRSDTVIALGGGVTGDLAGFAAATYMRGINFINIPTSLLAMVDSSVGGKTGIDNDYGKNLIGAFYTPIAVFCVPSFLETLPEIIFNDGMAEVIKYGVIYDRGLLADCENKSTVVDRIEEIIYKCISIKNEVVTEDFKENGLRRVLNFGHTLGHAAEKLSGYRLSHGKAVGFGMAAITRASFKLGLCSEAFCKYLSEIIAKYNLPLYSDYSENDILSASLKDKKFKGNKVSLVMTRGAGDYIFKAVDADELFEIISLSQVKNNGC